MKPSQTPRPIYPAAITVARSSGKCRWRLAANCSSPADAGKFRRPPSRPPCYVATTYVVHCRQYREVGRNRQKSDGKVLAGMWARRRRAFLSAAAAADAAVRGGSMWLEASKKPRKAGEDAVLFIFFILPFCICVAILCDVRWGYLMSALRLSLSKIFMSNPSVVHAMLSNPKVFRLMQMPMSFISHTFPSTRRSLRRACWTPSIPPSVSRTIMPKNVKATRIPSVQLQPPLLNTPTWSAPSSGPVPEAPRWQAGQPLSGA